jgi:signal transduction histidine kinase
MLRGVETEFEQAVKSDGTAGASAEKRDLLARLLGRLAHEIRNPLSSLDIHFQLLEEDLSALAPQAREQLSGRLEVIQGELHRLDRIVAQFLRLAGPSALEIETVDVSGVLRHVVQLLGAEAQCREIRLDLLDSHPLPLIQADPVRLTQALVNLVINAIQAVEHGGSIAVSASVVGEHLILEVSDTGPGIPESNLAAIFDPYYTTKKEGHGLGLWIAQQIVAAHSGTLLAKNRGEGGAAFAILLPLNRTIVPAAPGHPAGGEQ